MKTIIYNSDNVKENEINNKVYRVKALIINSKDEILIASSNKNYHFPGGHVEKDETFEDALVREIKEETGIIINKELREPFMQISYMSKDYPKDGINSKHIANYYIIKTDLVPNIYEMELTKEEKNGNFSLYYIKKDEIIDVLTDSLEESTRRLVTRDTIDVLKEFLNNY